MTYSYKIKEEISKIESSKVEKISELSGMIRTNSDIKMYSIRVQTENKNVANRIFNIVKEIYDVTCNVTVRKNYNFKKNEIYIVEIKRDVIKIIKDLGFIKGDSIQMLPVPSEEIVADDELKKAFLRGCFLISGSVNDPKTSRYHLEIITDTDVYAKFICAVLNYFKLNARTYRRKKGYMVYIKESEKISDFLKLISAYDGVLYYEDIRALREKLNRDNRINNCEQANVEKTINTAVSQIKDINYIKAIDAYDLLDDKLKVVAEYREKYPESSLLELSNIISIETGNKMTKSCLNHRLRKIKELAIKLKEKNN